MFDLAWSEIAVIVVVAVVVIGPKDLPDTIRTVAKGIGKLRRMAGQLQGHLDEVVREAKLEDVRDQIRDIRNFDIKGEIQRTVDSDGSLKKTFQEDPFRDDPFRAQPTAPSADAAPATPAVPVGEVAETDAAATPANADVVATDREPALVADQPPPPATESGRPAMGLDPLAPSAAVPPSPVKPPPAAEVRVAEAGAPVGVVREELPRPGVAPTVVAPSAPVPPAPVASPVTPFPAPASPPPASSAASPVPSSIPAPRDPADVTIPRDPVVTPGDARNA